MRKTRLEYYALPEEQKGWLKDFLKRQDIWAIYWHTLEPEQYIQLAADDIRALNFDAQIEFEWMIFFGLKSISKAPVYRPTTRGDRLDFVKSLAIQYVPSLVCPTDVLLEGQLAIMRRQEYEMENLASEPLFKWFGEVSKSLKAALACKRAVLIQRTTMGKVKEWKSVIVSEGAVKWRQSGRRLKQFPSGEVEFDVKLLGTGESGDR